MDEDLNIINTKTRTEKIKEFLVKNKKTIYTLLTLTLISIFSVFF